jgi:hypothetical protein
MNQTTSTPISILIALFISLLFSFSLAQTTPDSLKNSIIPANNNTNNSFNPVSPEGLPNNPGDGGLDKPRKKEQELYQNDGQNEKKEKHLRDKKERKNKRYV